jgi:hypothetical protein
MQERMRFLKVYIRESCIFQKRSPLVDQRADHRFLVTAVVKSLVVAVPKMDKDDKDKMRQI